MSAAPTSGDAGTRAAPTGHPTAHPVEWSDEKISFFWGAQSNLLSHAGRYFAEIGGPEVIRRALREAPLRDGRVCDLGCGDGHLLDAIVAAGVPCEYWGVDPAAESLDALRRRHPHEPRLAGTVTTSELAERELPPMDVAFLLEVVEHLSDQKLDEVLRSAHRVLRPGGVLVVTTPNRENIQRESTVCPDCGCVFHRWQHMRSWSADTLRSALDHYGFDTLRITETSLASRGSLVMSWLRLVTRRIHAYPNLIGFFRRRDG